MVTIRLSFLNIHHLFQSLSMQLRIEPRIAVMQYQRGQESRHYWTYSRVYSLTFFTLRAANYLAAMGAYHRFLWNKALPSLQSAAGVYKARGLAFHQEAIALAHQDRIAARHVIKAASRHMVTAIALRRHAWLHSAHISDDSHMRIEDLPFDGVGLFDTKMDEILDNLQKMRKTARSYNSQSYYRPQHYQW